MYRVKFYSKSAPVDIRKGFRLSAVGLKINCVNVIIAKILTILKMQSKQGNAEERPDAGCGIKR